MLSWPEIGFFSIGEFHDALSSAEVNSERKDLLLKAVSEFGYDTYLFGSALTHQPGGVKKLWFESNMSEEWIKEYEDNDYVVHDTSVDYCLYNRSPLLWSTIENEIAVGKYTEAQILASEASDRAGYRVGVTIPLPISWSAHSFGVSFCRKGASDFLGHDTMFSAQKGKLAALSRLFLTYFSLEEKFIEMFQLTEKQWEALQLSFIHRTVGELARFRGVSEDTIKSHRREVVSKLGVNGFVEAQWLVLGMGALPRPEDG